MANFSPNMLKVYQTCPKKYYFQYIENLQVPRSTLPFEKGKKIHALANYKLQGINISRIETALTQAEQEVWQTLLNNKFFKKQAVKSEYTISCKLDQYWIGGRLDAIVKDDERYYILDYKTGSTPKNPQYDFQTMVYLLTLDKLLNQDAPISFVYINLKDKKDYLINFNEDLKKQYTQIITQTCKKITTDTVFHPECSESECLKCEFLKICDRF